MTDLQRLFDTPGGTGVSRLAKAKVSGRADSSHQTLPTSGEGSGRKSLRRV